MTREEWPAEALRRSAEKVRTAGAGSRHDTLRAQSFALAPYVRVGALAAQAVTATLIEAAETAGLTPDRRKEAVRTITSGLDRGASNEAWFPDDPASGGGSSPRRATATWRGQVYSLAAGKVIGRSEVGPLPALPVAPLSTSPLRVTLFPALRDTQGREEVWTWENIVEGVEEPAPWPEGGKAGLELWSWAVFEDQSRALRPDGLHPDGRERTRDPHIEGLGALVLDYDDDETFSMEAVRRWWGDARYVAHTSASHMVEKALSSGKVRPAIGRGRVIVALSRLVLEEEWSDLVAWVLASGRGQPGATELKSARRAYYIPSAAPGGYAWDANMGVEAALDVDTCLHEARRHREQAESEEAPRIVILLGTRTDVNERWSLDALAGHPDVYCRGRALVRLVDSDLHPITADALIPLLSSVADFERIKVGNDGASERVSASPSSQLARSLVARGTFGPVRPLDGVSRSPILLLSGEVVNTPGYHAETRLLYAPLGPPPVLIDHPTQEDARHACERLSRVVDEMPLLGPCDLSAWLALVLTLAGRSAIRGPAPMFVATGNQARLGKTRALQLAGLIAHGRVAPTVAFPSDDSELGKRVDTYVFGLAEFVLWDNVRRPIGGEALEAVLTSTSYSGRVLGSSTKRDVENVRTVWAVSANGANYTGDAAPRTLPIRLFLDTPHPERRTFTRPDIVEWVEERRGELLGCALTVLRAYLLAGRPNMGLPSWGSFEAWSAVVRGALVWAGQPDPIETRVEIDQADVTASEHDQLCALALTVFGVDKDWTAAELAKAVESTATTLGPVGSAWSVDDGRDVLAGLGCWDRASTQTDRTKLGLRLRKYAGRPAEDGHRIVATGRVDRAKRPIWQVRR